MLNNFEQQIERKLSVLVGQKICQMTRACNMGTFGFGKTDLDNHLKT